MKDPVAGASQCSACQQSEPSLHRTPRNHSGDLADRGLEEEIQNVSTVSVCGTTVLTVGDDDHVWPFTPAILERRDHRVLDAPTDQLRGASARGTAG